jgi:TolA-binding protein
MRNHAAARRVTTGSSWLDPVRGRACRWLRTIALLCSTMLTSAWVRAEDSTIAEIQRQIADQQLSDAAERLRALDDGDEASQIDLTFTLARLARALDASGDASASDEFYRRSVRATARPPAESMPSAQVNLVRLAASRHFLQSGDHTEAFTALAPVLEPESDAVESKKQFAVKVLLQIGAAALADADYAAASKAYELAASHGSESDKSTAMLGAAWSVALEGDRPLDAAKKLAAFVEKFPEHDDAPRAARACAACLKKAEREHDASVMLADLLRRWPLSQSAVQVVVNQPDSIGDGSNVAPSVRQWLATASALKKIDELDAKTIRLALELSAGRDDAESWTAFSRRLAMIDVSGQATADALQSLVDHGLAADAERLSAMFIDPGQTLEITPAAREASCRWAGRTERWSMLALASESESPNTDSASRTISVERLLAEALMQTGRGAEARRWWDHLVDKRGTDDFATLLRCAETETSLGSDTDLAAARISAARAAAGDSEFRLTLVDLLDAELAIRRLQLQKARSLLESVVRAGETDAGLRTRAQWLIGETFYLQQDFAQAIEAYRRVEGIDPAGIWVAASLIQAGKAFEQLGRTREAAVCYWGLVNRFGDSTHAAMARRRLAAISPTDPSTNQPNNPTIRR